MKSITAQIQVQVTLQKGILHSIVRQRCRMVICFDDSSPSIHGMIAKKDKKKNSMK